MNKLQWGRISIELVPKLTCVFIHSIPTSPDILVGAGPGSMWRAKHQTIEKETSTNLFCSWGCLRAEQNVNHSSMHTDQDRPPHDKETKK